VLHPPGADDVARAGTGSAGRPRNLA